MKSRNFWGWLKIGVVVVVPLFVVLTLWARSNGEDAKGEPEAVVASVSASEVATNSAESTEVASGDVNAGDVDEMDVDEPDPGEFASSTNAVPVEVVKPAVADVKLSDGALELVKMAQSGVDEQVMLAFVTNYPSKFNLGSDQIIYLNDLGISGEVVRSMIERDAALGAMVAQSVATNLPPGVVANNYAENYPTNLYYPPTNYVDQPTVDPGYNTAPGYDTGYVGGDDSYFYSSLQPYGSWVYVSGYGRCWQPTVCVVNRNWQPYCDRGRWVFTDCGWYWQSDYSWGWAPFHYGRWFCDDHHGWVWRPGRTWGPAWVSWRNSSDYCGWAPLPPEARWTGAGFRYWNRSVGVSFEFGLSANRYCFVPVNRFCDYAPYRHRVGVAQAVNVYNHTKVVNNITVRDHKVVNRGIDPKHVAKVSGTEIRKVLIKDAPAGSGKIAKPDRLDRNNGSLAVIRPQLPPRSVVGNGTHADGRANGRGNGRNGNGAEVGSGLVATPKPPKSGGAGPKDERTTASNGKPVIAKPTRPDAPPTTRNPWPGRERDVVPPSRGGVVATTRPQPKPGDAPSKAAEAGSVKEGATASVGQPAVSKPASPFTPVTGPKPVVDSERKDLPAKSIVPIFTKREPAASPVGGAVAGATSGQNNANAGANHFVRPQTPSVSGAAGSVPVAGGNTVSSGRETYPPNSLVLIGRKERNDSAPAQPAANASGLPNMNLANSNSKPGAENSTSQHFQPRNGAQNSGAANPFSGAGNNVVVPTPGQTPSRVHTPITTQTQAGGNNPSAAQNAQMQALMSRWQNASKPAAAANTSPAVKESPVPAAPRWSMPVQSSAAQGWSSRAENHVTQAPAVTAPAASSFRGASTTPTPSPRSSYTPPAASSAQSAPAYRSAPAETHSAPAVRSSPAPSYSAPAQRSSPPSAPSRDTSSGSASGKGKR